MSRLPSFWLQRKGEIVRILIVVSLLFFLSWLIPSLFWRAVAFAVTFVVFVFPRLFSPPALEKDLHRYQDRIERIAEGNLEIVDPVRHLRSPILRDFGVSLTLLNARLRQMVDKVKGLAGSVGSTSTQIVELSRSLLHIGENQSQASEKASRAMEEIGQAIQRIAEGVESLNELGLTASSAALELTASIEEVTRNAVQVGSFAKDTQVSMGQMVRGIREISSAREMLLGASTDTDKAMRNMQQRIQEVTVRAQESDQLAERAATAAGIGRMVVADVEAEMQKIAETFDDASVTIANLAHRSEQIGDILNVINQVADQTNLLSLNAAILSAQAGVHGKGFAVVADEIRSLSNRTASSVKEIEQLISRVQAEIKRAVSMMEAGKERVRGGVEKSRRASESLTEILTAASASRDKVLAITTSSRAQIEAEKEVEAATRMIKERLAEITRVIEDQTRSGNEVYAKAERMIDLLRNVEKGMEEQTHGAKEVSHVVERVSEIIQNIHAATSQQSTTSSQVIQSVNSLRAALLAGTATIRALNATALSLDQEAFILRHELTRFQLPEAKRGGVLRVGMTARVTTIDPTYAQYVPLTETVYNFYEGLVEFGEGTDIRPCLAEKWETSPDGITYTFNLRKGARFHNGKEVSAGDVKASLERTLNPLTKSPGAWALEMITGAESLRKGKEKQVKGITVLDPQTVRIELTEPLPFFLAMLAQPYAYVYPSHLACQYNPLTEVCGTGPFRLDRFVPEKVIEMSRFEKYHSPPWPFLERVVIDLGMQETEIAAGLRERKIHYATELQKGSLDEFLSQPEWRARLQTNVQLYTAFLAVNCEMPVLRDRRVRQAISCAIDRERIVGEVVGKERAIVARTFLPPGLPGHDSHAQGANFDPARSRILLKQAGVQEGTKLEIWQEEANYNADVIGLIQENLRAVGIELQLRVISDRNAYRSALESARVPIRMTRWVADYPDPDNFLYVTFHSKLPVFNVRWRNPEFDRLTEQARVVPDVQERIRLYQRAERIWLEDMPGIILYHNRALVMHQEAVQGCIPHFTQPVVRLKKVWLSC